MAVSCRWVLEICKIPGPSKNKCCQSLSHTCSPKFQTLSGKTTRHDRLQSCLLTMPGTYSQVTSCICFPCTKSNRGSPLSKHPDHYSRFWCRRAKGPLHLNSHLCLHIAFVSTCLYCVTQGLSTQLAMFEMMPCLCLCFLLEAVHNHHR